MSRVRRAVVSFAVVTAITVPTAMATSAEPVASRAATAASVASITPENTFDIVLDAKGNADASKLPTASTLFTQRELTQVIPGLSAVSLDGQTQTLTIRGDSTSTIQIVLKRFGRKDAVTKAWQQEKRAHTARSSKNPGLYTFYDARLGTTDAFTDGTNTHVLVTKGDAAGEIWFSGAGFTNLADGYSLSRANYKNKIVPALTRLIGEKLAKSGSAPSGEQTAQPTPAA